MLKVLTTILLLFSAATHGQATKGAYYKNIEGLTIADSITWKDIVGGFYTGDGYGGFHFRLDSNMTFRKIDFSCMARFIIDSGSWAIKKHSIVVVKSSKKVLCFDVLKFGNYYFFIQAKQRREFISDLLEAKGKYKKVKPFTVDNTTYTINDVIRNRLNEKYFSKEIGSNTGG